MKGQIKVMRKEEKMVQKRIKRRNRGGERKGSMEGEDEKQKRSNTRQVRQRLDEVVVSSLQTHWSLKPPIPYGQDINSLSLM
jgi:hypothetical protein